MTVFNGVEFQVVNKMKTEWLKMEKSIHSDVAEFIYKGEKYKLHKFTYSKGKETSYSIGRAELFGSTMNIDKVTKRYISLYTYDMMGTRTTYKMALEEMLFKVADEKKEIKGQFRNWEEGDPIR